MKRLVLIGLLAASLYGAKKEPNWEHGKVLWQDRGTAAVAFPLYRQYNSVRIETGGYIYGWSEVGRKTIALSVGEEIRFYRDGDLFIILDTNQKKHKFGLREPAARQ
jgi:hypothetical protein